MQLRVSGSGLWEFAVWGLRLRGLKQGVARIIRRSKEGLEEGTIEEYKGEQ